MNPLTMPSSVLTSYARYRCCQNCWQTTNTRTAQTGWIISCDSGAGYSVSAVKNNCNITAKDQRAYSDCDAYSGASTIGVSLFALSFLTIFHLLH
jgi:hypothetical protein